MYRPPLFAHSSGDGHWVSFLFLATVNNAAMDTRMYSMCSFFLSLHLGVELSIIPVISARRRLRQSDCHEFEVSIHPDSSELV